MKFLYIIVAVASAFLASSLLTGCGAYKRPPALSVEERAFLHDAPLPYSVTVAWWDEETKTGQNPENYASSLARLVAASGTFKSSRYERSSMPSGQDLVATSTGMYCASAGMPIFSIISFGIIPTVWEEGVCRGMLLRTAAGKPKSEGVKITIRYKGTQIMGWVASIVGLLPGWGYGSSAENDSRFLERFRLEVIRRREDIDRLLGH